MIKSFVTVALTALLLGSASPSGAEVTSRGFQIGLHQITPDEIRELAEQWNVNVVRIQIGDNFNMDGVTGDAYTAMMEGQFAKFDELAPVLDQYGIKAVFAMYSPPGGFQTRAAPSHHTMFSNPMLQDAFVQMWRDIVSRYGSSQTIAAFDLLNEPAVRSSLVCGSCRSWNELLLQTVSAIREINPTVPLMIKSLYGDPTKLINLPLIDDRQVIYSYHAYPYLRYQHAGIGGVGRNIKRPNSKKVNNKLKGLLARFFQRNYQAVREGQISSYPPRLNAGEFGMSACAKKQPHKFLADIIKVLEGGKAKTILSQGRNARQVCDGQSRSCLRRQRRRRKSGNTLKLSAAKRQVVHESWTYHAFAEATVWDPRYECPQGEPRFVGVSTKRAQVLRKYLARNP